MMAATTWLPSLPSTTSRMAYPTLALPASRSVAPCAGHTSTSTPPTACCQERLSRSVWSACSRLVRMSRSSRVETRFVLWQPDPFTKRKRRKHERASQALQHDRPSQPDAGLGLLQLPYL